MSIPFIVVTFVVAASQHSSSRVNSVVTQLREEIFNGRRLPGSDLRELTIARELNVSQATVREALYRLEHAGLVTRKPHVGTTVTRLSPKDIRERVVLRTILECLAAEAAAPRMSEADFEELDRRLKVLSAGIETDNYYETSQADLDFHRYIWKCSGNETLPLLLELVTVPLFAFISIMRSHGLQRLTTVVASHAPLVAALRSRDSGQIRSAFQKGATSFYESFLGEQSELTLAEAFGFLRGRAD